MLRVWVEQRRSKREKDSQTGVRENGQIKKEIEIDKEATEKEANRFKIVIQIATERDPLREIKVFEEKVEQIDPVSKCF